MRVFCQERKDIFRTAKEFKRASNVSDYLDGHATSIKKTHES